MKYYSPAFIYFSVSNNVNLHPKRIHKKEKRSFHLYASVWGKYCSWAINRNTIPRAQWSRTFSAQSLIVLSHRKARIVEKAHIRLLSLIWTINSLWVAVYVLRAEKKRSNYSEFHGPNLLNLSKNCVPSCMDSIKYTTFVNKHIYIYTVQIFI